MPRITLPALALATTVLLGCGGGGGSHGSTSTAGVVRTAYTDIPLNGATVTFYSAAGVAVGTGTVGSTGTISGTVPAGASKFSVDPSTTSVTGTFYTTFLYDKAYYSGSAGCLASLPSTGSAKLKEDVVFFLNNSDTPPPPPDACGTIG